MQPYDVLFTTKGKTYRAVLNEPELCFTIQNITIQVEYDGSLYIDAPQPFQPEAFGFLSYTEKSGSLFLNHYQFEYCLPIRLTQTQQGNTVNALMLGSSTNDETAHYAWSLLHAHSTQADAEYAIIDLQNQLYPAYQMEICCCCQYGQANPYGGDITLNFLCFYKNEEGYKNLGIVNKADWPYFTNPANTNPTRPFYHCLAFSFRKAF